MNHDYTILFGDADYTIRAEFPDSVASTDGAGVLVAVDIAAYNTGSTELLAAVATTIHGTGATTVAAAAGEKTITMSGGIWEPGDLIEIDEGDDGPCETVRVQSFDSGSKVITLRKRLQYAHAIENVYPRWCTYSLDASGTDWTSGLEGTLVFTPSTDDLPWRNTFRVSEYQTTPGGFEDHFEARYRHYHTMIADELGAWDHLVEDANDEIEQRLGRWGAQWPRIASSRAGEQLHMAMIAYLIALGGGDDKAYEVATMSTQVDRLFEQLRVSQQWYDRDEDLNREDDEYFALSQILPSRLG